LPFWNKTKKTSADSATLQENEKSRVVVFVDFDHWHVSLKSSFNVEADIRILLNDLTAKYGTAEIHVFGDFTGLDSKLGELALMTENVYDVQGERKGEKDILVLDRLYRCGMQYKDTDTTVILISGSGRYALAVRSLRDVCNLKVGIYGVRGATSGLLKESANWAFELPNDEYISILFPLIIRNCVHLSEKDVNPTFRTTVDAVSSFNNVPPHLIESAVAKMLELGYLYQKQKVLRSLDTIKVICANWELMIKDGIYDPEKY